MRLLLLLLLQGLAALVPGLMHGACCCNAGQGAITAPGIIGAVPIEAPVDIEEGPPLEVPLIYYYGHVTPTVNADLYRHLVECLANLLGRRSSMNQEVRQAISQNFVF